MTGVIWFVQVVHYPLFSRVGSLVEYERAHVERTGWVVAPVMAVEAITGLILLAVMPDRRWLWVALGCLAICWGVTFLVHVPLHERLAQTGDRSLIDALVRWNWVRVAGWTIRTVLLVIAFRRLETVVDP
jgi:hypothetical protein